MRQKINDLITLLQQDRKTQVIAGAIVLCALFLFFGDSGKRPSVKRQDAKIGAGSMGSEEAYGDIMKAMHQDMQTLKTQNAETKTELSDVRLKTKENEERTAEILRRMLDKLAEVQANVMNTSSNGDTNAVDLGAVPGANGANGSDQNKILPPPGSIRNADGSYTTPSGEIIPANMVSDTYNPSMEPDELQSFGMDDTIIPQPPMPEQQKIAVVGAGDSVRVKLLAGVNAPTDGTPYPVVFKLVGDVYGPDGSALPLGEARLIAAAQGSLADSRALFRLSSLNIRLPNGKRTVIPVDGWVVGEDGIRGMEGVLIDPLGKAIGGAMITGGLDGFGRALSQGQVTTTTSMWGSQEIVTGDDTKYAAGRALSGGANQWSDIIKQRMELLVPHVEVLSGREATAVFSKSFTIKDLYNALSEDNQHFSSMD